MPNWQRVDAYQGNYPQARREAFRRSSGCCQFCGAKRPLAAHHWTSGFYPPGDRVATDDLTALCRPCHEIATCLRGMLRAGCSREQLEVEFGQAVEDREKWQALLEWTSTAQSYRNRMIARARPVASRPVASGAARPITGSTDQGGRAWIVLIAIFAWLVGLAMGTGGT